MSKTQLGEDNNGDMNESKVVEERVFTFGKARHTATVTEVPHPNPKRAIDVLTRLVLKEILRKEAERHAALQPAPVDASTTTRAANKVDCPNCGALDIGAQDRYCKRCGAQLTSERVELPPTLTVRDVMAYLRLSKATVHRLISSGQLPSYKVGGSRCIDREALLNYTLSLPDGI